MGFLSDLTGVTGARLAAEARRDAQNRERIALDAIGNAYGQALPHNVEARNQWDDLIARGQRYGTTGDMALSAAGLTDPSLARAAFRASPGYDFQLNQGLEAVMRRANTMGMLPSGNTMAELQRTGQGLAAQEWTNWQNQLQGLAQLGAQLQGQGTAGRAAALGNLASYARDYGRDAVGITQHAGQAVQGAMAQEASARMSGANNLANLGLNIAKTVIGNNGIGGGLGGIAKAFTGYSQGSGTGGLY